MAHHGAYEEDSSISDNGHERLYNYLLLIRREIRKGKNPKVTLKRIEEIIEIAI